MDINSILRKDSISREDIISLLRIEDKKEIDLLFARACEIREQYLGNEIHLRGIIEFSNFCEQNCLYCGLRKGNGELRRYRMDDDLILNTAELITQRGIKTIVLQSGEDSKFSCESIYNIIRRIKSKGNTAITLSLGERKFTEYEVWKEAGADRYLLKHETSNPKLYSIYHQHQSLTARIKHLRFLKNAGYQIGSGNIIGLPHQTFEDIAGDILLCKRLDVDMASFSPYIPSPQTPYRNKKPADFLLTLKVMAAARIVLKQVHIPATTALATMDKNGRKMGLLAGANVIMPNFTPAVFSKRYRIYPHKKNDSDINKSLDELGRLARLFKLKISNSRGDSLKSAIVH
ncbi:MAG TPA: [FeFe] hydrogenase H-cluster radical SAM maturase HydE [Ignavibacteriaceae bacterium]|nr:[FeFe] hydrogenase H-cluster radical SAM maturase HydE [Ignavibacteriaceae bacterium]